MASVNMTAPNDYATEAAAIERRRKMAELLQQQSMQPLDTNQTAGGYVVPVSWTQGLAKALQGYAGGAGMRAADEQQQALAKSLQANRADTLQKYMDMRDGSPESWQSEGMNELFVPAQKGNPRAATMLLAGSNDPVLSQLGMQQMLKEDELGVAKGGDVIYNKRTGETKNIFPQNAEYGTTPHFVKTPDGSFVAVYADKHGGPDRRVPMGNDLPLNQFTAPTVDAENRLKWDQHKFGNLSELDRFRLGLDWATLANRGLETQFNTGSGVTGPIMRNLPIAAPFNPGGSSGMSVTQSAPTAAIRSMPQQPVISPKQPVTSPSLPRTSPTPNLAVQGITPKDQAALNAQRPQATYAAKGVLDSVQAALNTARDLKESNIGGMTGPIWSRLPTVRDSVGNAESFANTLKSQIGLEVLQAMREASKTGGAVGNVTEKEWPILQSKLGALQESQTEDQYRRNLDQVIASLERMQMNSKSAYETTYGALDWTPQSRPSLKANNSIKFKGFQL